MKKKYCPKCARSKRMDEFTRLRSSPDGRAYKCRSCLSIYNKKRYKRNPQVKKNSYRLLAERAQRNRLFIYNLLKESPCVDCGDDRWQVLEFDHVRGKKHYNIATMVIKGFSLDTVVAELAKCEVRCASCHRLKTREQFDWFNPDAESV